MATTKALELAQLADTIAVNANGEISNIGTLSSLDISGDIDTSALSFTGQPTYTENSLGVYSSGTWLNSPASTNAYLGIGGSGILKWKTAGVDITPTTTSSSTTTGSLTVAGGLGVAENVNAGRLYARGIANTAGDIFTAFGTLGNVGINYEGANLFFTRDTANYISASGGSSGHLWFRTGGNNRRVFIGPTGDVKFTTSANTDIIGFTYTAADSSVDIAGDLTVGGDLLVSGNTTTLNVNTLTIEDLNITLANGAANSSVADGAGITIDGASATILYDGTNDEWDFNKNVKISGSLGVTNIVTNYIPKFNGVILDDSNISDDGTTVTITGTTASAGGTETLILANASGTTQIQFGTAENSYGWIQVDDSGTKRDLILQGEGGEVGIGVQPVSTLDVRSTSSLGSVFRKDFNGAVANNANKIAMTVWGQDHDSIVESDQSNIGPMIGFGARLDDASPNTGDIRAGIAYSYNGDLTFHAKSGSTVSNGEYERIRIDGVSGSVGINHNAPVKMLSVNVGSDSDGLFLYSNHTQIGSLSRTTVDSTVVTSLDGNTGRDIHIGGIINTDVILANAGGNVGINNTSPDYQLHVKGAGDIKIEDDAGGSAHLRIGASTSGTRDSEWKVKVSGSLDEFHIDHDYTASGASVGLPAPALRITGDTHSLFNENSQPSIRPTLSLDFANTKQLDPRITFARTSTGWYWDGKSTSKANQNYLRDTQDYTSGVWATTGASITSTTITDPYGGTTAAQVTADGTNFYHGIHQNYNLPFDDLVTFSAYVKQGTSTGYLQMLTGGTSQPWATFNLTNGTVGNAGGAAATSISAIGTNGWYRISITVAAADAPSASGWYIWEMPASTSGRAVQHTSSGYFYTWGWQVEEKANPPTEFLPTTNAPLTKYQPRLVSASRNIPRFDHDPLTGKSKGFLIEEGHTNLITYSESMASWTQMGNARRLDDVGIAPNGTQTADLLYITSGSAAQNRYSFDGQVVLSPGTYTFSMYIKSAGLQYAALTMYDGTAYQAEVVFDLINGTYEIRDANTDDQDIEEVGNGWYRCWVTATITQDLPDGNRASGVWPRYTNTSGAGSEAGDGDRVAQGILVWGAQLEQGMFASSYIPTSGSQATRGSDNATMTYGNLTDWYRFDEGTIFAEYSNDYLKQIDQYVLSIQNYSRAVEAVHFRTYSTVDAVQAYNDSATQGTFTRAITAGVDNKVALAYSDISSSYCLNGGSVSTDPYWVMPTQVWQMQIGRGTTTSSQLYRNGHIKKIAFYNERLSDAEIQALTEND